MGLEPNGPVVGVILEDKEENEANGEEENTHHCRRDGDADQLGL